MIKYIAFTYDKHLYATCYGIDPFAAERCPFANIFDPAAAGRGEMRCFTSLVGGDEYSLPRLQETEIVVADKVAKFLSGKGWIEVAGIRYNVIFDSNGIQCINPDGVDVNIETPAPEVDEEPTEPTNDIIDTAICSEEKEPVTVATAPVAEPVPEPVIETPVVEPVPVADLEPVVDTPGVVDTPVVESAPEDAIAQESTVEPVSAGEPEPKKEWEAPVIEEVSVQKKDFVTPELIEVTPQNDQLTAFAMSHSPETPSLKELDAEIDTPSVDVDFEKNSSPVEEPIELVDTCPTTLKDMVEAVANAEPTQFVVGEVSGASEDFMNKPEEEPVVSRPSGIGFSGSSRRRSGLKCGLSIGAQSTLSGVQFGTFEPRKVEPKLPPSGPRRTYTVTGRPTSSVYGRNQNVLSGQETTPIPSPAFAEAVAKSEDQLMESWREQAKPDLTQRWDNSTLMKEEKSILVEPEPIVDEHARLEQDKANFKESLSADVRRVIDEIPLSIVGPIAEFTTNPVNVRRLTNESDAYCIDNRWHKAGKWYCIDVVNETARYFFNSKLNVSIQIPHAILKGWLRVVHG